MQYRFDTLYKPVNEKNDLSYGVESIISVANMYFKPDARISDSEYLRTYNIFKYGDIAFEGNKSKSYANGRFVENTIGDGIVSHVFNVLRPLSPTHNLEYWKYAINNENVMGRILARCTKKTTMMTNLVTADFLEQEICCPVELEQDKIALFLSLIEKRLVTQERLVEHLKKYKRGAINNIFNGYAFDESVQECLLSDVASFHQGLTYSPEDVSDTGYLVMRSSNIQNGRLSFADNVYVNKSISESLFVQENDVLMCVRNGSKQLVGKTAIVNQPYSNMTWGAFMMIIRSKLKNTFVYYYLNSDSFFNQVFKDTGTATINQITKGTLNECRLFMPKPEQQERICKYLDLLDEKLHKEEDFLESLKLLKKSLLQHLFI